MQTGDGLGLQDVVAARRSARVMRLTLMPATCPMQVLQASAPTLDVSPRLQVLDAHGRRSPSRARSRRRSRSPGGWMTPRSAGLLGLRLARRPERIEDERAARRVADRRVGRCDQGEVAAERHGTVLRARPRREARLVRSRSRVHEASRVAAPRRGSASSSPSLISKSFIVERGSCRPGRRSSSLGSGRRRRPACSRACGTTRSRPSVELSRS